MSETAAAIKACTDLVAKAVPHCAPSIPTNPPPESDALANSLAAQANAISAQANYLTLATIILGILALVAAMAWGWLVKIWAEKAAKDAVTEWLDRNAAAEISKLVGDIIPNWTDGGGLSRPMSQTEQEEGLGGDPTKDPA